MEDRYNNMLDSEDVVQLIECLTNIIEKAVRIEVTKQLSQIESTINPDTLRLFEAAEYLKIKPQTLRMWNTQRRIPYHKVGRHCLYKKSDLDEYIYERKRIRSQEEIESSAITKEVLKRLDRRFR
jgi:excisionase family DNA binding protein